VLEHLHYLPTLRKAQAQSWELVNHPLRGDRDEASWGRALSLALTRTCRPAEASLRLIAPLFDCANHVEESSAELRWAWRNDALEVSTARDVVAGSELRICYGDHSAEECFLQYGFVPAVSDRASESVVLFWSLEHLSDWLNTPDDQRVRDWLTHGEGEAALAERNGRHDCEEDWLCVSGAGTEVDGRLLDALSTAEWPGVLRRRAQELIRGFGTTAEQDAGVLRGMAGGEAAAVRLRIAKRRVLEQLLAALQEHDGG
jgi:hypothetical protein